VDFVSYFTCTPHFLNVWDVLRERRVDGQSVVDMWSDVLESPEESVGLGPAARARAASRLRSAMRTDCTRNSRAKRAWVYLGAIFDRTTGPKSRRTAHCWE
jgi:hypothetical protein